MTFAPVGEYFAAPLILNGNPEILTEMLRVLEISCGYLGLSLELQALKESLRHTADNEQLLVDQVRRLTVNSER